jgi:SAM-dependent methyltransferase
MGRLPSLVQRIEPYLSSCPGPALVMGPLALGHALHQETGTTPLLVASTLKPRRLARQAAGRPALEHAVVRANPASPPVSDRSLSVIVADHVLSRVPDAAATLATWSRALRAGGRLVLVESLTLSPALRALQRLTRPRRARFAPEDLTAALLNTGFIEIEQGWLPSGSGDVVTSGILKVI